LPNLHERYAQSTDRMASGMIGRFHRGNYYVGDLDLKLKVGHTVSEILLNSARFSVFTVCNSIALLLPFSLTFFRNQRHPSMR